MSDYLFIGPFPPPYAGPTVKNDILFKELSKHIVIRKMDTTLWKSQKIRSFFKIMLSKEKKIVLAVSKNGRLLLPLLRLKKMFSRNFEYSLLPMGDGLNKELVCSNLVTRKLLVFGLKKTRSLFIQTHKQYREFNEKFPTLSVIYFPSFKNMPKRKLQYIFEKDVFKVVYVSTVKAAKGILTLINAISGVDEKVLLDIYGPIEDSFRTNFYKEISKHENINYCGTLEPSTVSETINKYQLFVFPTYWDTEGFANVLVDAMIASVPIIASDWNYNAEIVKSNYNGELFKPNDANDLKSKIVYLIKDKNKRFMYANNNRNDSFNYYIENIIEDFLEAIR